MEHMAVCCEEYLRSESESDRPDVGTIRIFDPKAEVFST